MNLLDNLNESLRPYIEQTNRLTDIQRKNILETITEDDTPSSIMNNMEKSYVFVHKCLMTRGKEKLFSNASEFLKTEKANRFVHVTETYALGMLLNKFGNLESEILKQFDDLDFDFDNYWLIISLLHDYGYYNDKHDLNTIRDEIFQIGSPKSGSVKNVVYFLLV